jgi:tetratricopeptide (TPR) repeat protein
MSVLPKAAIKALNDEAVYLSNVCHDYCQAIENLQRAMILCKKIELSHSASFSLKTMEKIQSSIHNCTMTDASSVNSTDLESERIDEGLYTYTRTLVIAPSIIEMQGTISFHALEALLCFNLGVCYLLGDNQEDEEAFLYFTKCEERLLSQSLVYEESSASNGISLVLPTEPFEVDLVSVLHNLGLLKHRATEYEEGIQYYLKAMSLSIQLHEADDMSVAVALNSIGILLLSKGATKNVREEDTKQNYCDAIAALERSILIRIKILGESEAFDRNTATVMNNLGRVHFALDDFEEAVKHHLKAYKIRKEVLGEDHIDTVIAAFNVANCYQSLEQNAKAFTYYAIFLRSAALGSENEKLFTEAVIVALDHLSTHFEDLGDYKHAAESIDQALVFARKTYGSKNCYIAQLLNRRGTILSNSEQFEDSLESYLEGLEIELNIYPLDHPNIAVTTENIESILRHLRNRPNIIETDDSECKSNEQLSDYTTTI